MDPFQYYTQCTHTESDLCLGWGVWIARLVNSNRSSGKHGQNMNAIKSSSLGGMATAPPPSPHSCSYARYSPDYVTNSWILIRSDRLLFHKICLALNQWKKYKHTSLTITSNGGKVSWAERKASSYLTSCYGHFNPFSFNYYNLK